MADRMFAYRAEEREIITDSLSDTLTADSDPSHD